MALCACKGRCCVHTGAYRDRTGSTLDIYRACVFIVSLHLESRCRCRRKAARTCRGRSRHHSAASHDDQLLSCARKAANLKSEYIKKATNQAGWVLICLCVGVADNTVRLRRGEHREGGQSQADRFHLERNLKEEGDNGSEVRSNRESGGGVAEGKPRAPQIDARRPSKTTGAADLTPHIPNTPTRAHTPRTLTTRAHTPRSTQLAGSALEPTR